MDKFEKFLRSEMIAQALVRNEHPEKSAIGIQLHRGRTCAQVAAAR